MSAKAPKYMSALAFGTEDGIDWCVVRAPLYGAVNGYARIPEDHPWHDMGYEEIYDLEPDLEVHGGLTFARDGWIGFDTLHGFDLWPDMPGRLHQLAAGGRQWDQEQVEEEARRLARQVASAALVGGVQS